MSAQLARRAADRRQPQPSAGVSRAARHAHIPDPVISDHARGWIAYGESRQLPPNASQEMRDGYAEHRNDILSRITAADGAVTVAN
jgi:hypothetical protein